MKKLAASTDKNMFIDVTQPDAKWYSSILNLFDGFSDDKSQDNKGSNTDFLNQNILSSGDGKLIMKTADGKIIERTGDRNFRNNNPGNINYLSSMKNVIGKDDKGFAIFDTFDHGKEALYDLLFNSNARKKNGLAFKDMTLSQVPAIYAPPNDPRGKNDPVAYAKSVLDTVGSDKIMSQYSESERQLVLLGIQNMEGRNRGTTREINSYAVGTNKIENTGPALIHKGEMIIPARNASKIRSSMDSRQMTSVDTEDDISEDFWINTFMKELANVVKAEYLGAQ
jgi:hypothetical protein